MTVNETAERAPRPESPVGRPRVERRGLRGLTRSPYFWGAIAGLVAIPILRPLLRHVPEPPPVLGQVPAFTLMSQDGRPFGSDDLAGHVYVANLVFSSCMTACPPLMRATATLQRRFADAGADVRLVSITVDPENDTPARLKAFARKYDADFARWTLLTGPERDIRALVTDGLKTHMGEPVRTDANLIDVAHSTHFILVDGRGRVRGYYGSDAAGVDETFHRALHVVEEERSR